MKLTTVVFSIISVAALVEANPMLVKPDKRQSCSSNRDVEANLTSRAEDISEVYYYGVSRLLRFFFLLLLFSYLLSAQYLVPAGFDSYLPTYRVRFCKY